MLNRTTTFALAILGALSCAGEAGEDDPSTSLPAQPTAEGTLPAAPAESTAPASTGPASTSPSTVGEPNTTVPPAIGSASAAPGDTSTTGDTSTGVASPDPSTPVTGPPIPDPSTTDTADQGAGGDSNTQEPGAGGESNVVDPGSGGESSADDATDSGGASGSAGAPEPGENGEDPAPEDCTSTEAAENFSFFLTSMFHIQELSGSEDGFGGDLRYAGAATGLEGADAICQEMARRVCHGDKVWRAFLSTSEVNAIDRIGSGPWYDHSGALVAQDVSGLAGQERPAGGCCDVGTYDELGLFHDGETNGDDHDTLTGSDTEGRLDTSSSTCDDWTSTTASGRPRIGHAWPRSANNGREWIMDHNAGGCAAGINISSAMGGDIPASVGSGGGYGGFYCFAESAAAL